jgi:urease accessory protein
MDASPGLFNGDVQEIDCTLEEGAHLFLTNQSSCKLHPSTRDDPSHQIQRFAVKEGALLEYFPEPIVPYAGSSHYGETIIFMETGAEAIIGEIITPGRIGREERFHYTKLSSQFSVYWNGKWTVWDSLCLQPEKWVSMKGIFDQYTHLATLWVLSERVTKDHVDSFRGLLKQESTAYHGVSLLPANGMVIRLLGNSVWHLQQLLTKCWDLVRQDLLERSVSYIRK